jgi:CRISPR-associated endonuclease Csn1
VEIRLKTDDPTTMRQQLVLLGNYDAYALDTAKPLFVSRAPKRRGSGAAHKATVYAKAPTPDNPSRVTEKVALSSLNLKDLERLVDPHRNVKLYAAIRLRLETYAANGGKFGPGGNAAFPLDNPMRKPSKDDQPTGPIVRAVTLAIDNKSGIPLRGGLAPNDNMIRVDVYKCKKDGKYHLVPVYVHHMVTGLPVRAVVAYKEEVDWTLMGDDFQFLFALCPNELIRITNKNEQQIGYYAGFNRSTGAINIWAHDRNIAVGKVGFIGSVGVKTAVRLEKLNVDLLGNIYPAISEVRRGLA